MRGTGEMDSYRVLRNTPFPKALPLHLLKNPFSMRNLFLTAAVVLTFAGSAAAQGLKTPAPSPLQTIDQAFALSNVKIEYSRPGAKGRAIFGDVVPFGKIWRTGANGATKITFGDDVMVGGKELKAGTYAIYSMPDRNKWEVMFYKDLTMAGNVANYRTSDEVLRVSVPVMKLNDKVESFTINMGDITSTSANLDIMWEATRVSVPIKANIDDKIMAAIKQNVETDNRPYFSAATYYYDNGKDLTQALTWVNKALESNPDAFWMQHLKAKIQLKTGDKTGAVASAQKSMELARKAQNQDYVTMNEKLIASAK